MGLFESAADRRNREALAWVKALHDEHLSEKQIVAYSDWMEADPLNADVFRRLDEAWITTGDAQDSIRASYGPEARAAQSQSFAGRMSGFFRPGLTPQFATTLAGLIVLVLVGLPPTGENLSIQKFATAIGETNEITMEDGSRITLNSGSDITIAYEEQLRLVQVSQGGAYFDVTSDANRPFVVDINGGTVEVLGTEFDVLGNADGFTVTVVEGRVSVGAGPSQSDRTTLAANQRAAVNTQLASLNVSLIDADVAAAWRRGQLVYRDAPLSEVVEELNRYSNIQLSLSQSVSDNVDFTGVLNITDPGLMMDRLAGLMRMTVTQDDDGGLRLDPID